MKNYTQFTPGFKSAVRQTAETLELTEVTTPRQKKNGTLFFHDPYTNTFYALYESGYVRRHTYGGWGGGRAMYQLNLQKINEKGWTERIPMNSWEQLGKMTAAVIKFRKNPKNLVV